MSFNYDLAQGTASHAQATSTGTANVQSFANPGQGCRGFLITVATNGCYLTLDGSTPSSSNGLAIPPGVAPVLIPVGKSVKVASQAAGNSVVQIVWVS
jgi:hypothetical protein